MSAVAGLLALTMVGAMAGPAIVQPAVRPFMRGVAPARSDTPAWFNLRLPGPETDPEKGPLEAADARLPARPAVFAPGPMDPTLDGAAIHRDVATIVGFSHESRAAGDYLWGRVTGRPAYDRTIAWTAEELRRAGLVDVRREPFRATGVNLPVRGEVRLLGAEAMGQGSRDIVLARRWSAATAPSSAWSPRHWSMLDRAWTPTWPDAT